MEDKQTACGGCDGACDGCGAAGKEKTACGACCDGGGEVLLCREELMILCELGQYAFLPVLVKRVAGERLCFPIPTDVACYPEEFPALVASLAKKRLLCIDPDLPLCNVDYGGEEGTETACHGSLALSLQGQEALDWLPLEAQKNWL